jgi:ribonucleotide reductase beta subunit family protein with ferritin-like domain
MEPLLALENNRMTVYPIKFPKIWEAYKSQMAAFWTAEEIDFSKDYDDFSKLNENEKHFIKMILSFFAASDTIVNINLGQRFSQEVQIREAIIAYDFQKMMESVHSEVYSLQIDNIIRDPTEKDKALNALVNYPCIKKKADWAFKWIESRDSFAQRLIAFAIVEGVFFSGAFCSIFWLKKRNLMPGLCDSNELISRDEGMHCQFACLLYSMINDKASVAFNIAGSLGTIIGPILGGILCDKFGFIGTCDIFASASFILGIVYFAVAIMPHLIVNKA